MEAGTRLATEVPFETAQELLLDYYHLSEHLHKVALAQFYDNTLQERQWVEATKARLFFGYLDWVLLDLEGMEPRDAAAAEEIRKLLGYLAPYAGRAIPWGAAGSNQPTSSSAM